MAHDSPVLMDGSHDAPLRLLLAHGAGAPMDSPFMASIASELAQRGWQVLRFEFPYMAKRRLTGLGSAPDRLPRLQEAFREQALAAARGAPLLIGGKSMGGRIASLLADELAQSANVRGCICLGYPFHPPGQPQKLRTAHLESITTPTLVIQGERDSFGKRSEVETYALSTAIQLEWMPSGDHSFKPTVASGRTEAENLALAAAVVDRFGREWVLR